MSTTRERHRTDHTACWHIIGTLKDDPHGPYAYNEQSQPSAPPSARYVFRCCHCGRHDRSGVEIPIARIAFFPGAEPTTPR